MIKEAFLSIKFLCKHATFVSKCKPNLLHNLSLMNANVEKVCSSSTNPNTNTIATQPTSNTHSACRNPSLGLTIKARACKSAGQEGSLGLTSHAPGSVGEYEGMNPHTPK